MLRIVIKTPKGYVIGIDQQHQCCTYTQDPRAARQFANEAAARGWSMRHSDAGYEYGHSTATFTSVEV